MAWKRLWRGGALLAVAALLATACTAGSDDSSSGDDDAGSDTTAASTAPSATGPSPGVTDDAVKIGVTYVDTAALVASGLNYDLGDHQAVYQALFDAINADGGINGRQIEPVYAPIDPTNPAPAEEKCVQLTEDEDVFMVIGFFLEDAVNCVVSTHATAVVGGSMTPDRLEAAQAPWATWTPDTDQPEAVVQAFFDQGELDGTVGVYAAQRDQESAEDHVVTTLEDNGVEVTETGIMDAPADDQTAVQNSVLNIAERFEAEGIDTVVLVGASAQDWPTALATNSDYRPKLLFIDTIGARAFYTNAATTDTSILDGSLAGGQYGPDQARFDEEAMQACLSILGDAGLDPETVPPDEAGTDPSNQPFQAPFQACPDVDIMHAWLDAAGPDLNYGTLAAALDGLEVHVSGDPSPRTFGPPPDADGNPTAYLFQWDEDAQEYVPVDG